MNILITGGSGFIGRSLAGALVALGHQVHVAGRTGIPHAGHVPADFTLDTQPQAWVPRLKQIDVVVNAVGIFRETRQQSFAALHTRAPQALFEACVQAGVPRVIQISALGAGKGHTAYFVSKRLADEFLTSLPLQWVIVRPSIVYGAGGASARLFSLLATLPVIPLPNGGHQQVQPIHIDDLTRCLVALCLHDSIAQRTLPLAGPQALSLRAMLIELRGAFGMPPAPTLTIPRPLMSVAASVAGVFPNSLLDRASLTMLEMGNTADPGETTQLLGRSPRDVSEFVRPEQRPLLRTEGLLAWLLPCLRGSIAAVWIWTAIVSFGVYPRERSFELLERTGVPAELHALALHGAALLDLLLGLATVFLPRRRMLWLAQILLIVGYSLMITLRLPEYWLHPYGPLVKNLPMLAAIYLLYKLEPR